MSLICSQARWDSTYSIMPQGSHVTRRRQRDHRRPGRGTDLEGPPTHADGRRQLAGVPAPVGEGRSSSRNILYVHALSSLWCKKLPLPRPVEHANDCAIDDLISKQPWYHHGTRSQSLRTRQSHLLLRRRRQCSLLAAQTNLRDSTFDVQKVPRQP